MTCAECMEAVLVANLHQGSVTAEPADPLGARVADIGAHVRSCDRCARAVDIFRNAQDDLARSLVGSNTRLTAEAIAAFAYQRVRRERLIKWTVLPAIALLLALAVVLFAVTMGADLKTFFTPPPAVETQTFSLNCLSGEQAAGLLRPYLPTPQNPMWQAERFDVRAAGGGIRAVTVRAPRATLARVPALLAQFERDPRAECRVQPPTP